MSRINKGQKFYGNIVDILNQQFKASTAQGKSLIGWYKSAWPQGKPFLVNKHDVRREEAVVWFPSVTDDPRSNVAGDWLTVVSAGGDIITTTYVGRLTFQETFEKVSRFIGKNHIVFARRAGQRNPFEFLGVYTSERRDDTFVYRRFAEFIEPNAWNRWW